MNSDILEGFTGAHFFDKHAEILHSIKKLADSSREKEILGLISQLTDLAQGTTQNLTVSVEALRETMHQVIDLKARIKKLEEGKNENI